MEIKKSAGVYHGGVYDISGFSARTPIDSYTRKPKPAPPIPPPEITFNRIIIYNLEL